MSGIDDADTKKRNYAAPYTPSNPIPTVKHYREEKQRREEYALNGDEGEDTQPSRTEQALEAYHDWREGKYDEKKEQASEHNRSEEHGTAAASVDQESQPEPDSSQQVDGDAIGESTEDEKTQRSDVTEDTSQMTSMGQDPKQQRKALKKRKGNRAEREVTDPVTHLPVKIHDFTSKDLDNAPQNEPAFGSQHRTATGLSGSSKSEEQLGEEASEVNDIHASMENVFPPPSYDNVKESLLKLYRTASAVGLGLVLTVLTAVLLVDKVFGNTPESKSFFLGYSYHGKIISSIILLLVGSTLGGAVVWGLHGWVENKIDDIWDAQLWQAEREEGKRMADTQKPESTQWLNSLFASVWPLVNPDLFTSLADTLEDVMQASLPRLVRMVSVEDIGQGSESVRILGVRWLPTGAAAKSVTSDGKLVSDKPDEKKDKVQNGSQDSISQKEDAHPKENSTSDDIAEGLEAEEGDFVNLEISFAYRARENSQRMRKRAKNAHIYLAFYLPANIKLPVWVELHGLIGTMRLRLQLTPDPPFFSLCTLTFLGQPKVDVSCVPLTKRGLDIMDLPLISNFVQSAVDAAMSQYVAPKSLTLDLKDMLMGDDFKKDTNARGVLMVNIKRAFDFKEGDPGLGFIKDGSADPYVTVGWAKFGKPVWSTRVMLSEMEPSWDETAFILVTPEELNVDESVRVQLWDSDRLTADDDLGRIEVNLKEIMQDPSSNGNLSHRVDGFKALKAGDVMPGKLEWSIGYFSKTRILESQIAAQKLDPDIKTVEQLKQKVFAESERKLREAKKDESREIEQQKMQDFKAQQDQMIINSPPPQDYLSGILSIQIHQVVGLELEQINKTSRKEETKTTDEEEEESDDLPSSYCLISINHQKVYRTRTKPKNGKPFFNAGFEGFIRNWQNTDVHVAIRDARVHENDPLLGVVELPLWKLFAHHSQVDGFFPISGGIGFGKIRLSLVFRAVQLQAPRQLMGWEYGTIEVEPRIHAIDIPENLRKLRLKLHTNLAKGKMRPTIESGWESKKGRTLKLAVRRRYSSALVIEFRKDSALRDQTPAFAVLWLHKISDNEEETITLPVFEGDLKRATTCSLENPGTKLGSIEIKLKLWQGLSGYHVGLAKKDQNVGDVMEILDAASDSRNDNDQDSSSLTDESDSDSSDDESGRTSLSESGKRGAIDQFRDYRKYKDQIHRKNRGLMQWKVPRTASWMKTKFEHGEQKVASLFSHSERDTTVQTEV